MITKTTSYDTLYDVFRDKSFLIVYYAYVNKIVATSFLSHKILPSANDCY